MAYNNNHHPGAPVTAPSYPGTTPTTANHRTSPTTGTLPPFLSDRPDFDIFAWHSAYLSCQRYFLDRSQHDIFTQTVASLLNIRLPFQWPQNPVIGSNRSPPAYPGGPSVAYGSAYGRPSAGPLANQNAVFVSLIPFVRRLVATGFDTEGILHGFFGDDWRKGIAPLQECERRNFLFSAKSVGWARVKHQYDMLPDETIPFINPLQNVQIEEIESAEKDWSRWLAMEDWMVGPRDPEMSMSVESRGGSN